MNKFIFLFLMILNSAPTFAGTWNCISQLAAHNASSSSCGNKSPPCYEFEDHANDTTGPYINKCVTTFFNGATHGAYPSSVPATYVATPPPPPCPSSGTSYSTGYYDLGTNPSVQPKNSCDGGCNNVYSGSGVEYVRLVNGVKHYYSKGEYTSSGLTCASGSPSAASPTLNTDGCSAGQNAITMGGRTKCMDAATGAATNPNSASSVAAADAAQAVRDADAVSAAQAIAAANNLGASGVASAAATAAGIQGAGGSGTGSSKITDPVTKSFCADNPDSKICADEELGTVDDTAVTNESRSVSITPVSIGSAGVCPSPSPFIIAGQTKYFSWTTYCDFASGIKPIMLVFAWLSAAGILIGGFRD